MYVSPIANDILAGHLINYGAVSFMTDSPMRLKSGLVTPIYVDNRSLTAHPDAWRDIIETFNLRAPAPEDLWRPQPCGRFLREGQAHSHH